MAAKKVWVCDDNQVVAESFVFLLMVEGYESRALITVLDAHRALIQEQPDLLLLDLHMASNGNRMLELIQQNPDWTFPVVLVTGNEDTLEKAVGGRVFAVLSKTVDPLELVRTVRRALGETI